MKYRPRWALLALGAVIVALLFSFPVWYKLFKPKSAAPGPFAFASDDQMAALAKNISDKTKREQAYYAMLTVVPAPTDILPTPDLSDASAVLTGDLIALDALRIGKGKATIFRSPDGSQILKLENFSVTNAPNLNLYLCDVSAPTILRGPKGECDDKLLYQITRSPDKPFKGTTGDQQYALSTGLDLKLYKSLVIYSETLDLIYSTAPLQ